MPKMPDAVKIEHLLDETEVAAILNCSKQTLRNDRVKRRGIPYIKRGRSVRYRPIDVKQHIDTRLITFD